MTHVRVNVDEDPCAADDDDDIDRVIREANEDILGSRGRPSHPLEARIGLYPSLQSGFSLRGHIAHGEEEEEDDDDDAELATIVPLPRPAKKVAPQPPPKGLKRAPPMVPLGVPSAGLSAAATPSRKTKKSKTAETATPTPTPPAQVKKPRSRVKKVAATDDNGNGDAPVAKTKKTPPPVPVAEIDNAPETGKKKRKVAPRTASAKAKKQSDLEPYKEKEEEPQAPAPVQAADDLAIVAPVASATDQPAAAVAAVKTAAAAPPQPGAGPAGGGGDEKRAMSQVDDLKMRLRKQSTFPSEDDLEKCGEWVLLALYTSKLTGVYGGYYDPTKVANDARHTMAAGFLYHRHLYLRTQVAAAWQKLCDQSGNTDMSTIARMMPHCKLFIDSKPKVYCQDAVCVWSGEQTNLHPVALVPITETNTQAMRNWVKKPGLTAIQFHIGSAFKEVLKCVHTLLFLLDYIPFLIEIGKKKAEMHLKGDWCPEMEQELEEKVLRAKSGPLWAIRKSVRDMIVANMKAFRAIVGPDIAAEFLVPFEGNKGCTIRREAEKRLEEQEVAAAAQLNV